jgi:hypothetical protein
MCVLSGKKHATHSDVERLTVVQRSEARRWRAMSGWRDKTLSIVGVTLAFSLLAAKCPGLPGARAAAPAKPTTVARRDSADQLLFGMRGVLTHKSVSRGLLLADTAFVTRDGTLYEMRNLRITFFDSAGIKNSELMARSGTYYLSGGRVDPRGEVTILGKDGRRLQTARAVYDLARNVIVGDTAYVIFEPTVQGPRSGKGFETDPQLVRVRSTQRPARSQRSASAQPTKPPRP